MVFHVIASPEARGAYITKTRVRGVYKHKSGGYIARLRRKGVSLSRTFASISSAERWITQTRIGLDDGELVIVSGEVVTKHEAARQERTQLNRSVVARLGRWRIWLSTGWPIVSRWTIGR